MRFTRVVATALLLTGIACNSSTAPSSTLTIMLKDSPFSDAKALFVTFSSVSVHVSGGNFVPLPFVGGATSRTCDLKKLLTLQEALGTGSLATGHYTQIRLVAASATLYFDNPSSGSTACASTLTAPAGRSAPVVIPSGEVVLNREFDVSSGATTTMVLDFDGDQSVKETGNGTFMMAPVVAVVSVQ